MPNYNSAFTGTEVDEAVDKVINGAGAADGLATLDGSAKVPTSQLPASVLGTLQYQGTWNANTNSPTLASGVGTQGQYYTVSVAGTTSIDGIAEWNVGDMIVYNGTAWEKIDNTEEDATSTVKGRIQLTGDLGGTAASPLVKQAGEDFKLAGVISASITSSQNDWSPTGLSAASVILMTQGLGNVNVTGLQGGSAGRVIALINVGTLNVTLVHESASSTAGNRFSCATDWVIPPGSGVFIIYDGVNSRWKVMRPPDGSSAAKGVLQLGGDVSGSSGSLQVNGGNAAWRFSGTNTPSQITSNQNNYSFGGQLFNKAVHRISSDAARDITGIDTGFTPVGFSFWLIENIGSFPITLKHASSSSSSGNRFELGGADFVLNANTWVLMFYDGTGSPANRYRIMQAGNFLQLAGGTVTGATTFSGGLTSSGRFTVGPVLNSQSAITYASTSTINFDTAAAFTLALTGDVTLETSNRAAGKIAKVKIVPDSSTRNITYPSWIGASDLPAALDPGDTLIIALECWGSNETDITVTGKHFT